MQKEKQLVPNLRFSEFDEEWKNQNLKEILTIGSGKDYKHLESGEIPVYGSGGLMRYVNDYLYDGDSIGIGRKGTIDKPIFLTGKFWTVDTLFYTHSFRKSDIKFIYNQFQRINWKKYNEAGGVPSLSKKTIEQIQIKSPSLPEQQKIANFITSVDNRIQNLEKKKILLKQYKKGVMQKIFKQELRFKDEDRNVFPEWQVKKIGEVFKERNEKNFTDMELLSVSINKGIYPQSESNKTDNSNSDKSKYKRVLKNDIAYNSMRMWQGASSVSKYDGIVSPAYTILESNAYNDSKYFGYLFKMSFMIQTFQKHSQGLTSDTWNLKYPMISKIKINVPSLEEQTKIANFLSAIDKNIALVNTKIEHTKAYKKGLLQQMFV